jgi:type IV pilus assembly protein PilE
MAECKQASSILGTGRSTGFTLIELMIVFLIIAVIAGVSYPSYTSYLERTRQSEVKGQMMSLSSSLENFRAKNFSYDGAVISTLQPDLANNKFYSANLSVTGAARQGYTLTVTPVTTEMMKDTEVLVLDHKGNTCADATAACTPAATTNW